MRKLAVLAVMLAMVLMMAAPASADTVTAGGLIAGTVDGGAAVAGSPNLANFEAPPNLPFGSDAAVAGNFVPPNAFALGINIPLTIDVGVAGVSAEENDVVAGNEFFGNDFVQVGFGNLDADTENGFLD